MDEKKLHNELSRLRKEKAAFQAQSRLLENFVAMARSAAEGEILKATMKKVLEVATELTGAEKGSLFLLNDEEVVTDSILTRGETATDERIFLIGSVLDKGLAGWVRKNRKAGLIKDTRNDHRWLFLPGQPYMVGSALAVPILRGERLFGILTLLHARFGHFSDESLELMQMTADQVALALENTQLYVKLEDSYSELESAKKIVETYSKALDLEMEKGRKIQQDFLPKELPCLPKLDFATTFIPAWQVSGDFYDAFTLGDRLVGLAIGDVSDKGVGAALFMALIRSLIRVFAVQCSTVKVNPFEPVSSVPQTADEKQNVILRAVDIASAYIAKEHGEEGMFATLFFGVLDPDNGLLAYVNAGHETVFVVGEDGSLTGLKATGPAVGIIPEAVYAPHRVKLNSGDILFGYTDGVTEARSPSDRMFTRARLERVLGQSRAVSAKDFLQGIETSLFAFINNAPQSDDITMLAVRWG